MAVPSIRAVGAVISGTAAVTPAYPTGTAAGDLALMFCETTGGQTPTCSGWTELTSQATGSGTAGTKATVLYRIVSDPATDNRTTNDPGDHIAARIIGITTGTFDSGDPFNTFGGSVDSSGTTSVTVTGVTTDRDECLVFAFVTGDLPDSNTTTQFASWANGSLTSVTERIDNSRSAGNGGAIGVASGSQATAGATGDFTVTATTSAVRGKICFAVQPPAPTIALAGTIAASSTVSGTATVSKNLSGSLSAASSVSGTLSVTRNLSGAIAAESTATGTLTNEPPTLNLSGTVAAASSVSGTLAVTRNLGGAVNAVSSVSGTLAVTRNLSGAVNAASSVSGTLAITRNLSGTVAAETTATGTLTNTPAGSIALSGTVAAVSGVAGSLTITRRLAGAISAASSMAGTLFVGTLIIPAFPMTVSAANDRRQASGLEGTAIAAGAMARIASGAAGGRTASGGSGGTRVTGGNYGDAT